METVLTGIVPVLPSENIDRDTRWYRDKAGFETVWKDNGYAILRREKIYIHLQWHADTEEDPLLGGSVIRIFVNNIIPVFDEFVKRGTVKKDRLILDTAWNTNEFGFYDLNRNAVFIVESRRK